MEQPELLKKLKRFESFFWVVLLYLKTLHQAREQQYLLPLLWDDGNSSYGNLSGAFRFWRE